jgi:hypothetical protein
LIAHGLLVDDQSRRKLGVAIGAAVQRASVALARLEKGEMLSSAGFDPKWTLAQSAMFGARHCNQRQS